MRSPQQRGGSWFCVAGFTVFCFGIGLHFGVWVGFLLWGGFFAIVGAILAQPDKDQ